MSAPMVWIILPIAIGLVLFLLSNKPKLASVTGTLIALLLAIFASINAPALEYEFGTINFSLKETFFLLGRSLTIRPPDLAFIALVYLLTSIWLLGSLWFNLSKFFPAIILTSSALLIAALSVEPFLYAALILEIFVMISIPLLSPANEKTSTGVLRYLILISLSVPFILMAGWLLSGIETAPSNSPLIAQASLALFIGFALLLAVIPFHSWIPMVSESAHPWVSSYIFGLLPTTVFMLLLAFIDRYAWLRSLPELFLTFRQIGTLMIAWGGIFIAFQTNLAKAFGYAVIIENGFALLAIGLYPQGGLNWFSLLIVPRTLGCWLWASCLAYIKNEFNTLDITALSSLMFTHPFISSGLFIAQLSIAGIPMLASFPIKRLIWFSTTQPNLFNALWMYLGIVGLLIFSIRILIQFLHSNDPQTRWSFHEKTGTIIPIVMLAALIFIAGLLPQILNADLINIINAFPRLKILP